MTEDEMVGWHHRLNGHESRSMSLSLLSELRELVMDREAIHGVTKSRTQLKDYELN